MTWKQCIWLILFVVAVLALLIHRLPTPKGIVDYKNEIDSMRQQHVYDSIKIHYLEGQADLLNNYKEKLP